jgi:hypothetical protein
MIRRSVRGGTWPLRFLVLCPQLREAEVTAPGGLAGQDRWPAPDRRERVWRQPEVIADRVTILATGKCIAACQSVSYSGRAAAGNVLCIRKEVPAMFTNRQTPPGIAL